MAFKIWLLVDDVEVLFNTYAMNKGAALQAARRAYPDGTVKTALRV